MIRSRGCAGLLLLAMALPALAQGLPGGVGSVPGGFGSQGTKKSSDDLLQPSANNPGVAPPLDIRIQGEGLSLPKGVSEDDQPPKPAAPATPPLAGPPPSPAAPDAKRP